MNYKIVETFESIQGEGKFTGAIEFFVRFAGCNVGKYVEPESDSLKQLRVLNPKYSVCKGVLGTEMICDTDYHGAETVTEDEIIARAGSNKIIRFTGGEPLLWNLDDIIRKAWDSDKRIHLETSGTRPIIDEFDYITCSPKDGFLEANYDLVDEWKFLVDFRVGETPIQVVDKIIKFIQPARSGRVFIQPVNGIEDIDFDNVEFAYQVIKASGRMWQLSPQVHKLLKRR